MVNQIVTHMAKVLKDASKKNDAPIWLKLAKSALKSNQKKINLKRINDNSDENNAVVVAGKVLGTGLISHKIILSSFSISNSAAKKIKDSGGEIIKFSEMIERFPTGKGVKIIG
tara:strand:- start:3001 stop:3342 length:342 start_codon:yes stop_codon:yes gene_type:complete